MLCLQDQNFPSGGFPLEAVDQWKPSNAVCVCDIPLCRSNRFGHSSSLVIACLHAEYIRDEAKTYNVGTVRLHVMDPENGVDSV